MENKGIVYNLIKRRKLVIVIVFLLFILGGFSYYITPKQEYPIVELPTVIITAVYPGASAADMEELVTSKIEDECMKQEGFVNVKSESYNSTCVIKMMFSREFSAKELQEKMDILRVRLNELRESELPSGITSFTYNDHALDTCGLIVAFTGEGKTNEELMQRANALKDEIAVLDGVEKTETEGEIQEQIKITVDSDKLSHIPVSLSELAEIINYQNSSVPIGTIEFENNEMYIESSGYLKDIDEIKDIIVYINSDTGAVVKLRDVAQVSQELDGDSKSYRYNGQEAVVLSVFFDESQNIIASGKRTLSAIEEFKKTMPSDISINKIVYLADDVDESINNFVINLIESVAIVLFIIMLGMSFVNGSIVSVVIPLAIFMTFITMRLFSIDVQFVSLASLIIALGMLVDNAIVVTDAIQVKIDSGEDKLSACVNGTKEVAFPVFSSMLTTIIIYCVFYLLPGTMKRFVFSLPTIVIAALIASYIISMLVTPVLCYMFMKKSKARKERKSPVRALFSLILRFTLKFRVLSVLLALLCIGSSGYFLSKLDLEFLPFSDKMLLDISIETDNFYDIRKTREAVDKVNEILSGEEGIDSYLSSVGGRIPKYDFTSLPSIDAVHIGSVVAKINNFEDYGFKTKGDYCQYIENKLQESINARVVVKEIGIVPKPSEPIQVDVCSNDMDTINEVSKELEQMLGDIGGVRDIHADTKVMGYNYYIDIKNDSLNSCGLTKAEVQNELNIAMMGREISNFKKNNKEYPILLTTDTKSIDALSQISIKSSVSGGKYKLSQVADIKTNYDYNQISRYNGKRCVMVTAIPQSGKSSVAIQSKLKKAIEQRDFENVGFVYEGDSEMLEEIIDALELGSCLGLFGIFIVLYLQFYSFRRTLIVFATIPFSLIGSSMGLYFFGENFSFFAILGIISLIGVVVNNTIVLVDYMDGELKNGVSVMDACKTAVDKRFRPIILSTTTTVFGLIPLALSGNVIFRGLAIAFMCGLSTSLIFTLVIIPVIYSIMVKKPVDIDI